MALSRYWRHPRCVAFVHVGDAERLSELLGVDAGLWVPAVPDPDAEGTHVGYQVLKLDARDQTLGELELSATSDLKKVWLVRPDHLHDVVALVEVLRARVDIAHVVVFVDHRSRTRVNADTPPIRNNRQAQGDPWFTDSSALVCLDGLRVVPYTTLWLCTDPDGWYTLTDEAPDRLIRVDRLTPAFVRQARRRAQDYLTTDKHLEHDDRPGNRTHGNMMVPMGEGPISGHLKVLIEGRSEPPDWVAEATGRAARIIQRRSVGVALGGGGTWGAAHIAILRALRRADVPVDYVSGTSFGALMGGLYAGGGLPALDLFLERCRFAPSGASRWMPRRVRDAIRRLVPAALEDLRNEARALTNPVAGAQRRGMLGDPSALDDLVVRIVTDTLEPPNPIAHVAADEDLCLREAHVPFFAVASSLTTHQEYAPYHLPLGLAVRAASGLPPGFPGMWFKGAKFIDGAALANVPCGVLKANGADFVIAINVVGAGKVARRTPGRPSVGTLGERITDTVTTGWLTLWKAGTAQAERYADALVDVRIRGVGLASTWRAPEIVEGLTAQLAEREVAEALRQAWHGAEPGDDLLRIALTVPEERG
jgi:predicted acylesterase/phospholipase RssA